MVLEDSNIKYSSGKEGADLNVKQKAIDISVDEKGKKLQSLKESSKMTEEV